MMILNKLKKKKEPEKFEGLAPKSSPLFARMQQYEDWFALLLILIIVII